MRMIIGAAAFAIAAAGFSVPTFAQGQDCVAAINQVQSMIGNSARGGSRSEVQQELDSAHAAYKAGDRRACLRHAERAADMARGGGFSGSSREPDSYYDRRRSDDRYYDRRFDDRDDRRSGWGR
jgi:hypothetical protein